MKQEYEAYLGRLPIEFRPTVQLLSSQLGCSDRLEAELERLEQLVDALVPCIMDFQTRVVAQTKVLR